MAAFPSTSFPLTIFGGNAVQTAEQASDVLDFVRTKLDCCLVIDGESLQVCRDPNHYISAATDSASFISFAWTSIKQRSSTLRPSCPLWSHVDARLPKKPTLPG